ncbi:glutamine synthetase [candidate division WOR-3 bacterium]|nr:glutamine synthetase [candidate division WOR-3 bacterium]
MKASRASSIVKQVEKQNVRFVQIWFTDVLGFLKGVTIPVTQLAHALEHGMAFDGSSIEGFARVEESDMTVVPDPGTFAVLPWEVQGERAGRVFGDVMTPAGRPVGSDPRHVLRRVVERCHKLGFTPYAGCELECFYFKSSSEPEFLDHSGYFDITPVAVAERVRHDTINALEALGVPVEYGHHEVSKSQHEVDLRYTDALTMADNVITARFVAKQVAQVNNVHISFMPKPVFGINGSGMHVHLSLFKNGRNAFFDGRKALNLSDVARQFIAGLLKYATEITAVTNQWVNSYKRLVPGYEAPVYVSWAQMNRSALVRVPAFDARRPNACRAEYRSPDPACNPYLAFACLVAAGLSGIEQKLKLGPPTSDNIYRMTPAERKAAGISSLPSDLSGAVLQAETSRFVREALGDELFEHFIRNKKLEWDEYKSQVTEYEIKRYLPIL